ncbi:hypothetical protein AAE478_009501 [Parahypoxylon ruwenzoriense]
MATVGFMVTYLNWRQACSGTVVQLQNGEWQDDDGSDWSKCDTESTPDPTCWNCTHFQFGWGHGSWHFVLNQTWPCTTSDGGKSCEISYQLTGSTVLEPRRHDNGYSYTSCTTSDFELLLDVYGHRTRDLGCAPGQPFQQIE